MTTKTKTKTTNKAIKASALWALEAAAAGFRLTAREAKPAEDAGLLHREPYTGWCVTTDRGRALVSYLIEYRAPCDFRRFFGPTLEDAADAARDHDVAWESRSTTYRWDERWRRFEAM